MTTRLIASTGQAPTQNAIPLAAVMTHHNDATIHVNRLPFRRATRALRRPRIDTGGNNTPNRPQHQAPNADRFDSGW